VAPNGLYGIREGLRAVGERKAQRELTFSIMANHHKNAGGLEGAFNCILFEITTDYGLSPGRPLYIACGLILIFKIVYRVGTRSANGVGIWKVWDRECVHRDDRADTANRIQGGALTAWGWELRFSILSAFQIGWRDLNVCHWIVRMQPGEYTLRATGWVRTVSGIQSMVSVYLVALSVLTYFGRPFE
jgi:hypothetical protein